MVQSMFDSFLTQNASICFDLLLGTLNYKDRIDSIANGLPTTGKNQKLGIIF